MLKPVKVVVMAGTGPVGVIPKVGVIAIGYGDGYHAQHLAGTPVFVNGRKAPIAGRVSMDILVDLGPDAVDKVGDEALWGKDLPSRKKWLNISAR